MKLENQCVSLELAKKLKDLGCKQESVFWWAKGYAYNDPEIGSESWYVVYGDEIKGTISFSKKEHCSAFTVAELGEMLPKGTKTFKHKCDEGCDKRYFDKEDMWNVQLWDDSYCVTDGRSESDARAKMLIYLLEQKLISPKEEDNK